MVRYSRSMSPDHRRYLVLEQGVGAAFVNFVLNGLIAWAMFHGHEIVPLFGQQSIAGDTIGTTFMLPLLTCLIVTPLARQQIRNGRLAALGWSAESHPTLAWVPTGTFWRGLAMAAVCTIAVAPLAIFALSTFQLTPMNFWSFVTFKASFAAVLAALVTPFIALWAIVRMPE